MDGTKHYALRLSLVWRAVFLTAAALSFSMVMDAFDTGDAFTIATTLAFFGFGGVVMAKIMLRNSGSIELREDGLLLDCYLCTGLIRWEHLEKSQALKMSGVTYLGLTTSDPEAYIASRTQLPALQHEGDRVLGQGFTRVMMALLTILPPAKSACSLWLSLFGFSPLPKQINEVSLMKWNQENYGSQIAIHKMWLPDFDQLLRELQQRAQPVVVERSPSAVLASHDQRIDAAVATLPGPTQKACPMCAERVQAGARICRYCRYSFDDERFLPATG